MKAVKGQAVSGPVGEDADRGTSVNECAGCQALINRLVCRADPIGMLNGENSSACDDSREGHDAVSRAEHRLPHGRQQVDAAVTWRPLISGLIEGAKDCRPRGQRPGEVPVRRNPGGVCPRRVGAGRRVRADARHAGLSRADRCRADRCRADR